MGVCIFFFLSHKMHDLHLLIKLVVDVCEYSEVQWRSVFYKELDIELMIKGLATRQVLLKQLMFYYKCSGKNMSNK